MRLDNCFSVSWMSTVLLSTTVTIASRNIGPTCSVRSMQRDNALSPRSSHTNGVIPLGDMFGICQIKLQWNYNMLKNFKIWIYQQHWMPVEWSTKKYQFGKSLIVFVVNFFLKFFFKEKWVIVNSFFKMVHLKR